MKIVNSSLNIFFPQIIDIRRQLFTFEDAFDSFQKPFTLTPLPENAPPEIPRICAISKHQHSQLNITTQNIQMSTNYDDNFAYSVDKCFEYICNKIQQIEKGINNTIGNEVFFSGLTIQVVIEEKEAPAHHIADVFSKVKSNLPLMDVSSRLTFTLNDKYYINITIENVRNYSGIQKGLSLSGLKQESEAIMITVDLNDRYAFNLDENYRSSTDEMQVITAITKEIITDKLVDLVEQGDFNYEYSVD